MQFNIIFMCYFFSAQVLGPNPILWLIPTYIGFPTLRNEGGHLYDCRGESWPQFEGGRRPV